MDLNKIQQKILLFLQTYYPDYVARESILKEILIPEDDLRREISFLEGEGLVELEKFFGGNFLCKLTSKGINETRSIPESETKDNGVAKIDTSTENRDEILNKIRNLEGTFQIKMKDHKEKMQKIDKRLDEFYVKLIEIFGIFAAILALVTFTGNAIFNSNFSLKGTFCLIVGFAISLLIFIAALKFIIKK